MKRLLSSLFVIVTLVVSTTALAASVTAADGATCMTSGVKQMAQEPITGDAFLCADPAGIRSNIRLTHLTPDDVYTLWFAYLDKRDACAAAMCARPDFFGDNPVGVFGHMDSVIADTTGNATLGGSLPGMQLSQGSEVWLLLFNHGAASMDNNLELARQLLTPQDPDLGAPAAGATADGKKGSGTAIAVFDIG
jgi:hypothetical protein